MYKKINKRLSWLVMKRNRVQVLTFSILLTLIQFIKLTFIWNSGDLFLVLVAQLSRFLVWSLTLRNFLKSGVDLMLKTQVTRTIIFVTKVSTILGAIFFTAFGVYMWIMANFYDKDVLSCKSPEFVTQSSFNLIIVLIFLFSACSTS